MGKGKLDFDINLKIYLIVPVRVDYGNQCYDNAILIDLSMLKEAMSLKFLTIIVAISNV